MKEIKPILVYPKWEMGEDVDAIQKKYEESDKQTIDNFKNCLSHPNDRTAIHLNTAISLGFVLSYVGKVDAEHKLEGGMLFDFTHEDGSTGRIVMGYTELGEWIYYSDFEKDPLVNI